MSTGVTNISPADQYRPGQKKKGLVPPGLKPYLAPILISCILLVGELTYRILESYWHTALAIIASILLELVLSKWATGKWPHLASAYITGISVGILVRSNHLWPYIVCSLLAISSKYALRVKNRHLWNPSNLGVSLLLLLAPESVAPLSQQWGNALWPIVIIMTLGSLILLTLGRLHISLTYVLAFTLLSVIRTGVNSDWSPTAMESWWVSEIALLTQPSYQLFIFFMITDPKTTTRTWRRQCAVAVLVAVVETLLRLYGGKLFIDKADVHAPYYALFLVAPVTNLLEIWWDSRHPPRKAAPPAALPAAGSSSPALDTAIAASPPSR
jgi:Na+-translocating ferredoxin:NAD+ oxidoreductase RnfD subunit